MLDLRCNLRTRSTKVPLAGDLELTMAKTLSLFTWISPTKAGIGIGTVTGTATVSRDQNSENQGNHSKSSVCKALLVAGNTTLEG